MKKCIVCNKEIPRKAKKFCSLNCYHSSMTGTNRPSLIKGRRFKIYKKNCRVCGKEFEKKNGVTLKQWNHSTTCSLDCFNSDRRGSKLSEETKKKISLGNMGRECPQTTRDRISKANKGIKRPQCSGENNYRWIKDRNKILDNKRQRSSFEMMCWRKACFERDNFTCQKTGQRGGKLVVHHINNFADFPELRTSIENGITLIKTEHIKFHSIYGTRNNTRSQLLEFLTNK